jgi:hypothetical protein
MWDKLKGLVIESDPAPAASAPQVAAPGKPLVTPMGSTPITFTPPGVNMDFVNAIKKAIFSRPSAYLTLLEASTKLEAFIADPNMRMKAAWQTSGGGRSAQEVVNAVTAHLADVDGEERKFNVAVQNQIQTAVGTLVNQAATLRQDNDNCRKQVEQLTQQITQLNDRVTQQDTMALQLDGQITDSRAKLDQSSNEFKVAAQVVRDELSAHRTTITSTL